MFHFDLKKILQSNSVDPVASDPGLHYLSRPKKLDAWHMCIHSFGRVQNNIVVPWRQASKKQIRKVDYDHVLILRNMQCYC